MNAILPMSRLSTTIPVRHYEQLVRLAQERDLVFSTGRPNVSAAARAVLAEVLEPGQGEETEEANGDG